MRIQRPTPHRSTLHGVLMAVVLTMLVLATGCTSEGPDLLLLPDSGGDLPVAGPAEGVEVPDARAATVRADVPGADPDDCQAPWTDAPTDAPVVELPGRGFTLVRTGPVEGGEMTLVCDFAADGSLLVADDLRTTGTDRSVGNDYAVRAGAIAGRVDLGIPEEATLAVQSLDSWTLVIPLSPEMAVVRLHALEGGSAETGYDIGSVAFLDADGTDITAASIPIPEVVHGVPRSRGSSVTPRD